jgi:hypothetical protein
MALDDIPIYQGSVAREEFRRHPMLRFQYFQFWVVQIDDFDLKSVGE